MAMATVMTMREFIEVKHHCVLSTRQLHHHHHHILIVSPQHFVFRCAYANVVLPPLWHRLPPYYHRQSLSPKNSNNFCETLRGLLEKGEKWWQMLLAPQELAFWLIMWVRLFVTLLHIAFLFVTLFCLASGLFCCVRLTQGKCWRRWNCGMPVCFCWAQLSESKVVILCWPRCWILTELTFWVLVLVLLVKQDISLAWFSVAVCRSLSFSCSCGLGCELKYYFSSLDTTMSVSTLLFSSLHCFAFFLSCLSPAPQNAATSAAPSFTVSLVLWYPVLPCLQKKKKTFACVAIPSSNVNWAPNPNTTPSTTLN